ncbi:Rad52/Rad22 family DNA repair protein [Cylindrospermopsis raciborskii]|uniref:Rad52/Rad22 family DNA repair protein n=1 Tax=Cylindrospermopsis raciborskii TaxID=77022 RepID=UPI0022C2BDDD|nr:Rad52/Rad22 family DNA repair protein [Cylindrospermopsis raciborskii]MCZ2207323.1 Rad52/Rad22 family DNA repair protein [Cylindrospermopsis raciborskii PAMP2011]
MINERQEQLKQIISELKKPLAPELHQIRDLPGGGKWVYVSWQAMRERLDQVCPDWTLDYSEITTIENQAFCKCGLTILGVRKEAFGNVTISVKSAQGKEMTRGSFGDRVVAEAFKNAAEQWGLCRYLDDQINTVKYLLNHIDSLSEPNKRSLKLLANDYKINIRRSSTSVEKISDDEVRKIWSLVRTEFGLSNDEVKNTLESFKLNGTRDIPKTEYNRFIDKLRSLYLSKQAS